LPRERLTLEALVAEHRFNAGNHRHRRALDESTQPLEDPQLEQARQQALYFRRDRWGGRGRGPEALQAFADLVNG
jgi:hypothetical protein